MKAERIRDSHWLPYFTLLLVFVFSRLLYDKLGITYLGDTYQYYWQFINPSLLKTDLWRSIYYLHSQPPLMNLLTGIVLQALPGQATIVFGGVYFLAGMGLTVSMYYLGTHLGLPRWLAGGATVLFMISPSTIIYEHLFTYGYPIAAALAGSGLALHRFLITHNFRWGVLFFSLLASIALSWTLFHLVWLLAIFCIVLIAIQDRGRFVFVALIPLLLVVGWYTKNLLVFGEFTAGTWGGMNLANTTTFRLPESDRRQMIKTGELSPFAKYPPFRNPAVYLKLLPNTHLTGIPILDITEFPDGVLNYHHEVYVATANYYLHDALHVIRVRPKIYFRSVLQSLYIYFHSSSDYELIWGIRQPIRSFDLVWNRLFYGQWSNNETPGGRMIDISLLNVGWWIVAAFGVAILGTVRLFWKKQISFRDPQGILSLFMILTILYVTVIGNCLDLGENNRFRYVIDSFVLVLTLSASYKWLVAGIFGIPR